MATKRRVFYSFHFDQDSWRVAGVRNMGVLEGEQPAVDNDWENIKRGKTAIKRWIDGQLHGRACTVVLIGQKTAERRWVKYEIQRSWELNKGIVGIYIHNLKDCHRNQSIKGKNPFENVKVNQKKLSEIVKTYDPPYRTSKHVYNHIKYYIADWIEEAIKIREKA